MSLFNRLKFWLIGILVGDCTYIKNVTFDWRYSTIKVKDICYWDSTHTRGDPVIINNAGRQKLSESMLIST